MFYFLIITASILIVVGVYMDKPVNEGNVSITSYREVEELYLLNSRIEYLEQVILEDISSPSGEIQEDKGVEDGENTVQDGETLGYGLEKYKLLQNHEKEGHSIEKICALLNMSKGEVLLLKNLYKNYPN